MYTSSRANAITDGISLQGLLLAGHAFSRLIVGEDTLELREQMSIAAYLSGVGLANAGLGVVHGFASLIGARREIPHGVVCGLLVGPATQVTVERALATGRRDVIARYANAACALLGCDNDQAPDAQRSAIAELVSWLTECAGPLGTLADYRFEPQDAREFAEHASQKNHPVELTADDLRTIVGRAM